ncbi:MAG: GGDEF domain-containing protein [Ruminiclostridium sp.]|nr:GGDEF domain-containing protein [Ruminiclostridium sp.]
MKPAQLLEASVSELKNRIPISTVSRFKTQKIGTASGKQILSACVSRYNCRMIPLFSVLAIIFTIASAIISGLFRPLSPLEIAGICLMVVTAGCGIGFAFYFGKNYPAFYHYIFWGLFILSYFIRVIDCVKSAEGLALTVVTIMVLCTVPIMNYGASSIMMLSVPLFYTILCCANDVYFYYYLITLCIGALGFFLSVANYSLFCTRIINSKQIKEDQQIIKLNAIIDKRTGLYNRSYGAEYTNEMISKGQNIAVFVIDIDHFKEYNRYHGTQKADKALIQIANAIKIVSKPYTDIICHIDSDKIMVCTYADSEKEIISHAEDIRSTVRTMDITFAENKLFHALTVSVGVAKNGLRDDFDTVYEKAMKSLYTAKKSGGNCVAYKDAVVKE